VSDYVQLVHVTEKTRDYHAWQYLKYRRDGTIILINQMIDIIDKTKIDCGLSGYSIEPTESGSMVYAIHRYPPFRGHLSKSLQRRTWGLICHMHKYLNQKEKHEPHTLPIPRQFRFGKLKQKSLPTFPTPEALETAQCETLPTQKENTSTESSIEAGLPPYVKHRES